MPTLTEALESRRKSGGTRSRDEKVIIIIECTGTGQDAKRQISYRYGVIALET